MKVLPTTRYLNILISCWQNFPPYLYFRQKTMKIKKMLKGSQGEATIFQYYTEKEICTLLMTEGRKILELFSLRRKDVYKLFLKIFSNTIAKYVRSSCLKNCKKNMASSSLDGFSMSSKSFMLATKAQGIVHLCLRHQLWHLPGLVGI